MGKFKALSLVLLGMVIGLGYAVACGSSDDKGTAGLMLPGVGVAMAQGGCSSWQVMAFNPVYMLKAGSFPLPAPGEIFTTTSYYAVPDGWTPLGGDANDNLWMVRCAQ